MAKAFQFQPAGWHTVTPRIIVHGAEPLVEFREKSLLAPRDSITPKRRSELQARRFHHHDQRCRRARSHDGVSLCVRGKRGCHLAARDRGRRAIHRISIKHALWRPPRNGQRFLGQYLADCNAGNSTPTNDGKKSSMPLGPSASIQREGDILQLFAMNGSSLQKGSPRWLRFISLIVIGTVAPYAKFVPWLIEHGLNLRLFVSELFSTRIGGFSAWTYCCPARSRSSRLFVIEGARRKLRLLTSLPIGATCLIGVSCGLPLFLYLRERQLATQSVQ